MTKSNSSARDVRSRPALSRRAVLGGLTVAAPLAGAGLLNLASAAPAVAADDAYPSNTALYADPAVTEGVDYARRYRRHALDDQDLATGGGFTRSVILAPHGGGIEVGTSELCLAVAGYHPDGLAPTPPEGPRHDFWMFEGLRSSDNGALHVTATHCDDTVARSLAAASFNALALHGCTAAQTGLGSGVAAVLVGGRNASLKKALLRNFAAAGITAADAADKPDLAGVSPDNIANRTLRGEGAQLEITTELRAAMFEVNTRAGRKKSTTPLFWDFTAATRAALATIEAAQPVL
ncbi:MULTISPECIES: poly-gamma-glutamate hydrolase family protein [unclassified Streptomyces]|uniref:poly-gamma-glutamate hydrolase family protein n=1 Tax=unclassified Streptomyces TaxID=2593676 RepID=UPI00101083DA|nr:poly-gamma-glutamate hydrolase family protein [Streptomyces sp. GZWMJZ-114]